jgi:hypothetical protein
VKTLIIIGLLTLTVTAAVAQIGWPRTCNTYCDRFGECRTTYY